MQFNLLLPILIIFILLIIIRGLRIVREDCRLVIFRLGKFIRVAGPGPVYIFPHIDEAQLINLNEVVPHWLSLSQEQLNDQIKNIVLTGKLNVKK
jgi:regulator of protease activity HflC (stomatin/prohibitin superfamily)